MRIVHRVLRNVNWYLDYDDDKDGKKGATAEEKRLKIKQLIESIPTAKDELFAYSLDWNIVDQVGI